MDYRLQHLGDNAVVIVLDDEINNEIHQKVQRVSSLLDQFERSWFIEYIPTYTSVTIFYDPYKVYLLAKNNCLPYHYVCSQLHKLLAVQSINNEVEQRVVQIPICYGGQFGPDLHYVAQYNGLTTEEVIDIHSNGEYVVNMIGFSPGFPFISGMSEKLATPRRASPRMKIPARSLGIAGQQTGIYPIESPGGWQLIGRTPLELFLPTNEIPSLLRAGDRIKFEPITLDQYNHWEEGNQ